MSQQLDLIINENHDKLNKIDLHILSYIRNNLEYCTNANLADIAKGCNASAATVLRTAKKLGFSGFSEFKYFLKSDVANKENSQVDTVDMMKTDVAQTIKMFSQNVLINEIYSILDKAEHIYAYGTGLGQRLMLQEFSRCMLNLNKHVILIPASGEFKIISKHIKKNDLVIIASLSGNVDKYRDSIVTLGLTDVPVISITNVSNNELSSIAKYNLYFQNSFKNTDLNINRSSYLTLHLALHLLYDGFVEYVSKKKD